MTEKQHRYVEAYLGEAKGNALQAARIAGYKDAETSSKKNTQNYTIRQAIEARRKEQREITNYTVQDSFNRLQELAALAVDKEQVTAAIRAEELAGKLLGFYEDKVKLTHEFERMSDSELITTAKSLLGGGDPQAGGEAEVAD